MYYFIGIVALVVLVAGFVSQQNGLDQVTYDESGEVKDVAVEESRSEESAVEDVQDTSLDVGTLDRSGQGLTSVSQDVFAQQGVTTLDLSYNDLSGALPAEVRHMTELRVLDLSHNTFTGVPAEVGQLAKLEVLNLAHNPITGLPYEIGNLANLNILDLRGTQYSRADLEVIRQNPSFTAEVLVD